LDRHGEAALCFEAALRIDPKYQAAKLALRDVRQAVRVPKGKRREPAGLGEHAAEVDPGPGLLGRGVDRPPIPDRGGPEVAGGLAQVAHLGQRDPELLGGAESQRPSDRRLGLVEPGQFDQGRAQQFPGGPAGGRAVEELPGPRDGQGRQPGPMRGPEAVPAGLNPRLRLHRERLLGIRKTPRNPPGRASGAPGPAAGVGDDLLGPVGPADDQHVAEAEEQPALEDADDRGVASARQGLQLIGRKIDGPGPEPGATPEQKRAAVEAWRGWYESVRPLDASAIDEAAADATGRAGP
ncbi:hypothetical protein HK102_013097, partial [Quaeritorhiza haematococci]